VLGHSPFDGLVLLSFEKKVIDQKFMLVSEVKVGEMMKVSLDSVDERCDWLVVLKFYCFVF
jgi:rRNA biogenesis protein RRP5